MEGKHWLIIQSPEHHMVVWGYREVKICNYFYGVHSDQTMGLKHKVFIGPSPKCYDALFIRLPFKSIKSHSVKLLKNIKAAYLNNLQISNDSSN